jgi:hypothetical protein
MRSLIAPILLLAVVGCDARPSPDPENGLTVEESAACVALLYVDGTLTDRPHGLFQKLFSPLHYGHQTKVTCPDNDFVVEIAPDQPGAALSPVSIGVDIGVNEPRSCAALTGSVEVDYLHPPANIWSASWWQRTSKPLFGQLVNGSCLASYSVDLSAGAGGGGGGGGSTDILQARVGVNGQFFGSQVRAEVWIDN